MQAAYTAAGTKACKAPNNRPAPCQVGPQVALPQAGVLAHAVWRQPQRRRERRRGLRRPLQVAAVHGVVAAARRRERGRERGGLAGAEGVERGPWRLGALQPVNSKCKLRRDVCKLSGMGRVHA